LILKYIAYRLRDRPAPYYISLLLCIIKLWWLFHVILCEIKLMYFWCIRRWLL